MTDIKSKVCDFNNLYEAMTKCRKGVMWKDSVARVSNNALVNTLKLQNSLIEGTYKIDKYYEFTIHEPKRREIVSTKIKDRIFQRSLCDNYLYETITKSFVYDNCACQTGKGTDFARDRLNCHMQRFFRKHKLNGYVLNCDMKNYFGSTPHSLAKETIRNYVKDEWVLEHIDNLISSYAKEGDSEVGLGLGSQITQILQLAVLDKLDHYIKEELKIKQYIRYMDDFILIHHDKEYLKKCLIEIERIVTGMGLDTNKKKTQIFPLKQGINFLGFKFRLTDTGRVIRLLDKSNIKKRKRKLRGYKRLVDQGRMTREKADECYVSWKAHAKNGNSYQLIKRMDSYYENLWKE